MPKVAVRPESIGDREQWIKSALSSCHIPPGFQADLLAVQFHVLMDRIDTYREIAERLEKAMIEKSPAPHPGGRQRGR